ncbi:MAG: glycosyltransferase [Acidobacteriota bacterium]
MPSFYQDDLLNVLSASDEVDLQVIFAHPLTSDRAQLGWKPQARNYPHRTLSSRYALGDAMRLARAGRERLHIVNGIWAEPAFAAALGVLAKSQSQFLIYSEAPDPTHPASGLKKLLRNGFGKWVAHRSSGLLAVSHFAAQFYAELGFDETRIYPFGYFRALDDAISESLKINDCLSADSAIEIIFVGQLARRKGIDILLDAIAPLCREYPKLKLTLIGVGESETALRQQAENSGITGRVGFIGAMPSDEIPQRLAKARALVLPSRWDGWGLVVNEALTAGVPVIVSDRCGAADLIQQGVNGFIFRSENVDSLRRACRRFLNSSEAQTSMRRAARATGEAISAAVAAAYLIDCLQQVMRNSQVKPMPPWAQISFAENRKF